MKILKKLLCLTLSFGIMLGTVGCTYQGKTVYFDLGCGRNTVFKIGDMKCSKSEALVYLLNAKNIYGVVDDTNLWSEDFNTDVINTSLKDLVLEHLTRVYVLNLYAMENEITLTDSEKEKCAEAAEVYYSSLNSTEISFTGTSEKEIEKMYEDYALASKVYTDLMNSVDDEVSEDEARVMEAYVLFVETASEAAEIQDMIDYGYTFERLAATYTKLDTYDVTFARGDYCDEIDEVVFNLDTDEVSGAIEADGGYYFFQCLDKYIEDLSEENKTVIIKARQAQALEDITNSFTDEYFSDMNTTLWDSIEIPEDATDLTSGSFYETLSQYL